MSQHPPVARVPAPPDAPHATVDRTPPARLPAELHDDDQRRAYADTEPMAFLDTVTQDNAEPA